MECGHNIDKLMVIVDEQHMHMLDKIMHQKMGSSGGIILTESQAVKLCFNAIQGFIPSGPT
jgi:ABC-type transport system involved in cytochrome c biogenesis ATPase subunit